MIPRKYPLLLSTGFCVFLLSCRETRNDQPIPDWKIAYNVLEDSASDNYEIYVMGKDGSGKTNISCSPDSSWVYYAWKDKLYFLSDRDTCERCFFLYEMDAAGMGVRKVTDLQMEDSWMGSRLNGKEMVVSGRTNDGLRYQLFLIDIGTGDFQQLTHDTAAMHRDPVFTPDGHHIVFVYRKNRDNPNQHEELWIMESDGKHPRQLTFYPSRDTSASRQAYHTGPPRWNPVERYFSYPSRQQGKYSIFAVSPDGKQRFKVTECSKDCTWHDWSPDGRWLALDMADTERTGYDIYLMDWETGVLKQLTDSAKPEYAPVFVEAPGK